MSEESLLFGELDENLGNLIDFQYFNPPRDFRSLVEVLNVLGNKVEEFTSGDELLAVLQNENPAYNKLLEQRQIVYDVIEEVVKFQQGGLNNTVETMTDVVKEYNRGREDIRTLRRSLAETKEVLTAKKSGQMTMRDLWLKKVEAVESLRILKDLEYLKDVSPTIHRLLQHRHYLTAVTHLNKAVDLMFGEDLVEVTGLTLVREQVMDIKNNILESLILELQHLIMGFFDSPSNANGRGGGHSSMANTTQFIINSYKQLNADGMENDAHMLNGMGEDRNNNGENGDGEMMDKDSIPANVYFGGSLSKGLSSDSNHMRPPIESLSSSSLWPLGWWDHSTVKSNPLTNMLWNLEEVNESMESSMRDPSSLSSACLFIRLLVKSIGALHYEEDVERLLLDSTTNKFSEVVRRLREAAVVHRTTQVQRHQTAYSHSFGSASQATHAGDKEAEEESTMALQQLNEDLFVKYVAALLDSGLRILNRLFYVLRLLAIMHKARLEEEQPYASSLRSQCKYCMLTLWQDMEQCIINELQIHFVEQSVEEISDETSRGNDPAMQNNIPAKKREWDNFDDGVTNLSDKTAIFPTSARLAAPIYPLIQRFANQVNDIFWREGIFSYDNTAPEDHPPSGKDKDKGMDILKQHHIGINSRILDWVSTFLRDELIPLVQLNMNTSLRGIQSNNGYFITPINSLSSQQLRSTLHLNLSTHNSLGLNDSLGVNKMPSWANNHDLVKTPFVNIAAFQCLHSAQSLLTHWLQMSQHSNMIVTILERLVHGYISCAREELDAMVYNVLSNEEPYKSALQRTLDDNIFYWFYKMQLYNGQTSVEDYLSELAADFAPGDDILAEKRNSGRTKKKGIEWLKSSDVAEVVVAADLSHWGSLWDINAGKYPTELREGTRNSISPTADMSDVRSASPSTVNDSTRSISPSEGDKDRSSDARTAPPANRVIKDPAVIRALGSLVYGCDWLSRELCKAATESTTLAHMRFQKYESEFQSTFNARKQAYINSDNDNAPEGESDNKDNGADGNRGRRVSTRKALKHALANAPSPREEMQERNALLIAAINGMAKALSEIAREGMAVLVGECQVGCFHHLRPLARHFSAPLNTSFSTSNSNTNTNSNNNNVDNSLPPVVSNVHTHLNKIHQVLTECCTPATLALVFAPLCKLLPRILLKCIQCMYVPISIKGDDDDKRKGSRSSTNKGGDNNQALDTLVTPIKSDSSKGNASNTPAGVLKLDSASKKKSYHSRVLKLIVAIQKNLINLLETANISQDTFFELSAALGEEFERVRRYVTLLDFGSENLLAYMKSNFREYSASEFKALWYYVNKSKRNRDNFEEEWKAISHQHNHHHHKGHHHHHTPRGESGTKK